MKVFLRIKYTEGVADQVTESLGIHTANIELLKNLLRYSKEIDEFGLLMTGPSEMKTLNAAFPDRNIRFHYFDSNEEVEKVLEHHDIFFMGDYAIAEMLKRRAVFKQSMSVVGITHSLHEKDVVAGLCLASKLADRKDVLVCTSSTAQQVVRSMLADESAAINLKVIPLGVDVEKFAPVSGERKRAVRESLGLAQDALVFLYLGRLSPVEKMEVIPLIRAFALLVNESDLLPCKPVLAIVGREHVPGYIGIIEGIVATLGVADRVKIVPGYHHQDIPDFYASADVFVSPSDNIQETFGLTVIEAMSAGLPVIASSWNGYRDNVHNGINGFAVPTCWADCGWGWDDRFQMGQSVAVDLYQMAGYMRELALNHGLRELLGRNGREYAIKHLSWERVVEKYDRLFVESARGTREATGSVIDITSGLPSLFTIFSGYPSHVLSPDDLLILRDPAGFTVYPNVQQLMDLPMMSSISNMINGRPAAVSRILEAQRAGFAVEDALINRQLMLLLKYGVIEIVSRT